MSQAAAIEQAVWRVLSARRWFGKHVEDEEMDSLEADLCIAIAIALDSTTSSTTDTGA